MHTISRRALLAGSATTAAAVGLSGCGGDASSSASPTKPSQPASAHSAKPTAGARPSPSDLEPDAHKKGSSTTPLSPPASLHEAPMLAKLVKAGKLPPVAKRLPEHPYVVPHYWVTRGKYGGVLTQLTDATSDTWAAGNWSYGFSPLRLLNDGVDVGPGWIESWTSNKDLSVWTFHLRKGVRWSDGHPVTTADVLFWWNDMVNDSDYLAESVPDDCKSGRGTPCELTAANDYEFTMTFDAPAPLTPGRLGSWSNGCGGGGPSWIVPAHYVRKFHPKYAKDVPKDWASPGGLWETHCQFTRNPKCPTLSSWRLSKVVTGRYLTWERNPYCYEVTPDGDQLPYLDGFVQTQVGDPEVMKLKVTTGGVDWSDGKYSGIGVADVSTLLKGANQHDYDVFMWDSGSGSGAVFFLNLDYYEADYRNVFAHPEFRQALSLAFNRSDAHRAIYFNTGVVTTGTMSPKAADYLVNAKAHKVYTSWRDSFVQHDPARAKKLLDKIGVVDTDGDGLRNLPGGGKLTVRIDCPSDARPEYLQTNAQLVRDWKEIGIDARQNPVPPNGYNDNWSTGKYMGHSNWQVGDGPSLLQFPPWLVPIEPTRWAPLQGQMYASKGTPAYTSERNVDPWKRKPPRRMPEAGGPVARLWKIYDRAKVEVDQMKRYRAVWQICAIHRTEGPFFQGSIANYPQVMVKNSDLANVPTRDQFANGGFTATSAHPTPAVYDPEAFYWNNPDKHEDV